MTDVIVIVIVLVLLGAAVVYIRGEKKRGVTCIGCPHGATCAKNKNSQAEYSCKCHSETE